MWGGPLGDGPSDFLGCSIDHNKNLQDEFFEKIKLIFLETPRTRKMTRDKLCTYIINSKPIFDKHNNFVQLYVPHEYSYVTEIKKDYFVASFDGKWCSHDRKFLKFDGNPKNWLCKQCFVEFISKKDTMQTIDPIQSIQHKSKYHNMTEEQVLKLLERKCPHVNETKGIRSYGYCKNPSNCNCMSGIELAELQYRLNELRGNVVDTNKR